MTTTTSTVPARQPNALAVELPVLQGPDFYSGDPVHVNAYLVSEIVDLLEYIAVMINPIDHDAAEYPATYRLRALVRGYTALLEQTLADHDEALSGDLCRREVAELDATGVRSEARKAESAESAESAAARATALSQERAMNAR